MGSVPWMQCEEHRPDMVPPLRAKGLTMVQLVWNQHCRKVIAASV